MESMLTFKFFFFLASSGSLRSFGTLDLGELPYPESHKHIS
jgi:hypothetical protein